MISVHYTLQFDVTTTDEPDKKGRFRFAAVNRGYGPITTVPMPEGLAYVELYDQIPPGSKMFLSLLETSGQLPLDSVTCAIVNLDSEPFAAGLPVLCDVDRSLQSDEEQAIHPDAFQRVPMKVLNPEEADITWGTVNPDGFDLKPAEHDMALWEFNVVVQCRREDTTEELVFVLTLPEKMFFSAERGRHIPMPSVPNADPDSTGVPFP